MPKAILEITSFFGCHHVCIVPLWMKWGSKAPALSEQSYPSAESAEVTSYAAEEDYDMRIDDGKRVLYRPQEAPIDRKGATVEQKIKGNIAR